jgi:hypothetical protein
MRGPRHYARTAYLLSRIQRRERRRRPLTWFWREVRAVWEALTYTGTAAQDGNQDS